MNNWQTASIDNIQNGDAKRKFDYELRRAIADCMDPNKTTKKARTVILRVKLHPKEDRQNIELEYQAESKLLPDKPGAEHLIVSGDGQAYVNNVTQMSIDAAFANGEVETMEGTND